MPFKGLYIYMRYNVWQNMWERAMKFSAIILISVIESSSILSCNMILNFGDWQCFLWSNWKYILKYSLVLFKLKNALGVNNMRKGTELNPVIILILHYMLLGYCCWKWNDWWNTWWNTWWNQKYYIHHNRNIIHF